MSVNKVILIGRLTKDPELKTTSTGKQVCSFGLATNEKYNGTDKTTFHNIKCWAKTAEICGKYLSKGSQVFIEGKIDNHSYEKDGVKKYVSEVIAMSVQFLDPKKKDNNTSDNWSASNVVDKQPVKAPAQQGFTADDIPW